MLLLMLAVVAAACSTDTGSSPDATNGGTVDDAGTAGVHLRVIIPDMNIRPEGAECSGARPYRHLRPGVAYTLETPDGDVLTSGELPTGNAENADPTIDWEDLARIPTVCIMEVNVGELPDHPDYELHIEGAKPIPFGAEDVAVGTPIVLMILD